MTGLFQDDNARIQQAHFGQEWFREHEASFSHMDWSPRSPDLNPTENFWDVFRWLCAAVTLRVLDSKLKEV